jgi:glycosyltransferase involved in cell wall biosynthesis
MRGAPGPGCMRVLVSMPTLLAINNYFYRRGGSEAVFFEHNRLLAEAGWEIVPFSMQDAKNEPTPWASHFIASTEARSGVFGTLGRALGAVYSVEAARRISRLLREVRPDIAHAHNLYHHLSPSVLVELKRRDIPTVMTLHDLKLACPAYKMHTQGAVCESCRDGHLRHVIAKRCIKDSLAQSALVWLESSLHRTLGLYARTVTRFVVPSRFFIAKFADWGFDTSTFVHIPNSVQIPARGSHPVEDVYVYAGRLVPEKGLATLIRAAARARVRLKIVGTGFQEPELKRLAHDLKGAIEFTGYLTGERLHETISRARAVVVPSEWYENAPMSVMEASALGRPVIGADIGGIPELIRPGETGFVFRSGDVDSLVETLEHVSARPLTELEQMGEAGRAWMRDVFSPVAYRRRVLELYGSLGIRWPERQQADRDKEIEEV